MPLAIFKSKMQTPPNTTVQKNTLENLLCEQVFEILQQGGAGFGCVLFRGSSWRVWNKQNEQDDDHQSCTRGHLGNWANRMYCQFKHFKPNQKSVSTVVIFKSTTTGRAGYFCEGDLNLEWCLVHNYPRKYAQEFCLQFTVQFASDLLPRETEQNEHRRLGNLLLLPQT